MNFEFIDLESEYDRICSREDAFVRIGATFSICDEQGAIYTEPYFPVVELAAELQRWMALAFPKKRNFEFNSFSTADPGWVWIRWTGSGWKVGSILQERIAIGELTHDEVRALVDSFVVRLTTAAKEALGTDILGFIT